MVRLYQSKKRVLFEVDSEYSGCRCGFDEIRYRVQVAWEQASKIEKSAGAHVGPIGLSRLADICFGLLLNFDGHYGGSSGEWH